MSLSARDYFAHCIAAGFALLSTLALAEEAAVLDSRYNLLHGGHEVLDRNTGLVWSRCPLGMNLENERCAGSPDSIAAARKPNHPARATPWRVPTQEELLTLVLFPKPDSGKPVVDAVAFPDTPRQRFEATGGSRSGDIVLWVDFADGRSGRSRPLFFPVRLVRDAE